MRVPKSILPHIDINRLRTFCYLKLMADGSGYFEHDLWYVADILQMKVRSVENHISWLMENGWVKPGGSREGLRVVGWRKLIEKFTGQRKDWFVILEDEIVLSKKNFRAELVLGTIEITRRRVNGAKKFKGEDVAISVVEISASEIGSAFGRSKTWGSQMRALLVNSGHLCMRRCRKRMGNYNQVERATEGMVRNGRIFWCQGAGCFILEKKAKVLINGLQPCVSKN